VAVTPRRDRPLDLTPVGTDDLPLTPPVDRNIPAEAWADAPAALLALGDDIGQPQVVYLRRIGPWLLWRAGPGTTPRSRSDSTAPDAPDAAGEATRWMALHWDDLERRHTFEVAADGTAHGRGPGGTDHERFRSWKEDLQQHRD
jgi:hypothetical protein